ncbi:nucleoside transporter [bacterium]|nr:nucleoside transporter [candidate division CSSED10-310 bacterium]
MERYNLISFFGMFVIIMLAWLFSNNRRIINWRVVGWGLGIQIIFAILIFTIPATSNLFLWLNNAIVKILECGSSGSQFVFGRLAYPPGTQDASGQPSLGFFLAFQGLPAIIFFSALTSILYYYNILPWCIRQFARLFNRLMGLSGAESLCAASNIFVGVESALTIQPHIRKMTRSELCTVLTCGMATVASNVLAVYVFFLRDLFPTIAAHLISASLLSAPAALMMAKLVYPETEQPETMGKTIRFHYDRPTSIHAAIINGAQTGMQLILSIAALLIAILGIVALADLVIGFFGYHLNQIFEWNFKWNLASLMGYLFYIPTIIIGIPADDAWKIAQIIGERSIVTELTAYQDLAVLIRDKALLHGRSAVIATYALCGFAHVASIGIFVGGFSALAPERTHDIAKSGIRALVAATLACLLTACIAGVFYNHSSLLFNF